jgi:hypothetical protein
MFFIVSSDMTTYRDDATQAAIAAGATLWGWNRLRQALSQLSPGDELSVDNDISVIRLTGKDTKFIP